MAAVAEVAEALRAFKDQVVFVGGVHRTAKLTTLNRFIFSRL